MADDLNTEIKIGADASGVEAGVGRAKRSLADLGASAKKAGKDAGDGVGSIGAGGEKAAKDVERATKSMQGSLQRLLAEQKAGAKGSREYWEALADTRGVSRNSIKPILDQIDAAKSKTLQAKGAADSWYSSFAKFSPLMATAFSGAALVGFTGKVVAVQREFDVLNSSLKTVTGSSAAAEREMAWLKDFAKETPFGLAQATQGFVKMKALGLDPTRAALTSFGNTASAMGKDLNQMIEAVADASTGEFERLKEFGIKAKKEGDQVSLTFQGVTKTIGNSAAEITKYLEDIGNTSFGGAMEERAKTLDGTIAALGDTWDELFRTVSTNNVGGLIFDSVTLANGALEDATTILRAYGAASSDAARETGALSSLQGGVAIFFETVGVMAANTLYVLKQTGDTLGGLAAVYKAFFSFDFDAARAIGEEMRANGEAARREIDATTARILNARKEAGLAASGALQGTGDFARMDRRTSAVSPVQVTTPGTNAAGIRAANKALEDQAKLIAELSGLSGSFAADWDTLNKLYAKGKLSLDGLTEAQSKLLAKQPAIAANIKAEEEAWRASLKTAQQIADARNKEIDGIQAWIEAQEQAARQALQSVADRVASLRDEEQAVGLAVAQNISLAEAVEQVALARLQEKQAGFYEGSEGYEAIQKEIAARKELLGLVRGKAQREAATDAAKKAAEEWQRTADDINQSLTEALMRGFESGKGFAENLRSTLKNMFSTLVLRPVISAVMSPVAGAINGMLYGNAAAAAGGGASALGMLGSGANLITGLQGTQGMLGTVGGWLGLNTVAANAQLAASLGIDAASAAAAANAAGAAGGGLLSGVGAALPWIGGIAALASILGGLDDSGTYHTGGAAQYSGARGLMSGQDATGYNIGFGRVEAGAQTISAVGSIAQALGTALDGVAVAFGQTAGYEIATAFADDTSKDGAWGALRISREGQDLLNWETNRQSRWAPREFGDGEEGYKQYLAAVAKDTRQVLLDMDLPGWADKMLESIGESAGMEQLSATVQQIAAIKTQFVQLGKAMEMFDGISSGMESALLSAAGSIDALTASAAGYYDAVYTEQEKIARSREQLESTLAGYGQSLPATREQYRALVEQQMAAGESGAEFAVVLMGLAGTFAQVVDDIDAQFADLAKSAADVFSPLLESIKQARADVAGTRANMLKSDQAMTASQIAAAIGAAMVYAPSTAGVVGAQGGVAAAAAQVAASKAAADAAQATASGLYGGLQGSISARDAAASEQARLVAAIAAARANYAKFQDGGEFRNYSYSNRVRNMGIFAAEIQRAQQQLDALQPSLDSYNAAVAAQQAVYDAAQGAANGYAQQLAAAQAALATAQQAEVQARADYAAQINSFVVAASNSVGKLSSLREEVVRYYEEQAQAVQTLLDQIGGVQSGVRGAQASILKPDRIDYAALAVAVQQAMGAAASSAYAGSTAASQDLERMSALQGDVLAYYEQQKQAVADMLATAKNLRGVIDDVRASTLTAQQGAAALAENYSRSYAMALSTTGAVRDGYVREMADSLPALATSIKEQATSRAEWQIEVGRVLAQANSAAGLLEADAGADGYESQSLALLASMDAALSGMSARVESDTSYLSTSLGLLGSIDTALAQLEGSTQSAEQVISQAIKDGTASQLTGLRAVVAALRGDPIPAFATGGFHAGGLRLVGESGPELEATGPSRIWSAQQTAALFAGNGQGSNEALVSEIRALRSENQAQAAAMVNMQRELNKLMQRWDSQGMPEERIV